MKKKLFIATLTMAMAVAIGWNLEQKKEASSNMSSLTLANIEALADGETCEICYGFALKTISDGRKVCKSGSFGPCNIHDQTSCY